MMRCHCQKLGFASHRDFNDFATCGGLISESCWSIHDGHFLLVASCGRGPIESSICALCFVHSYARLLYGMYKLRYSEMRYMNVLYGSYGLLSFSNHTPRQY